MRNNKVEVVLRKGQEVHVSVGTGSFIPPTKEKKKSLFSVAKQHGLCFVMFS